MIRVVSYNILAQAYVKSALFPHSPSACLRWKARSQAVLKRLLSFKADFLCLQELDEFESFYKEQLNIHGYSSVYVRRTGKKRDGCGIFFRQGSVELVSNESIYFNDLVPGVGEVEEEICTSEGTASSDEGKNVAGPGKETEDRGDPTDPRVRMKRDCVGIMSAFRVPHASDKLIVLVNTHLYWDPDWIDVKLAQAKYLVSRVLEFQGMLTKEFQFTPPVIICGDFNSMPGDQVYNFLTSGMVNETLRSDRSTEMQIFGDGQQSNTLSQPSMSKIPETTLKDTVASRCSLPLCSLYGSVQGEPAFTNCTPEFTGTLDYIFFSPYHLKPVSLLELPSPSSLDVMGGLPNYSHPSDHLPVGSDFVILDRK